MDGAEDAESSRSLHRRAQQFHLEEPDFLGMRSVATTMHSPKSTSVFLYRLHFTPKNLNTFSQGVNICFISKNNFLMLGEKKEF